MKSTMQATMALGALLSVAHAQMNGMNMTNGTNGLRGPEFRNTSSSTACADVHFFVARASREPKGQGIIGALTTEISTMFPGSTVEALDYPALIMPYNSSSYNGTMELTSRMKDYIDGCDRAKVVLMGYSQGAHVIGDVMCGGGGNENLGPATPPIDKKYADKVVAMIQMGDPRFVMGKSYDVGSSNMNGIFARPENISCDEHGAMIQSYCDMGDPFCASGDNATVHARYLQNYNMSAHEFVMQKLKDAGVSMNGSGSGRENAAVRSGTESGLGLLATIVVLLYGVLML